MSFVIPPLTPSLRVVNVEIGEEGEMEDVKSSLPCQLDLEARFLGDAGRLHLRLSASLQLQRENQVATP